MSQIYNSAEYSSVIFTQQCNSNLTFYTRLPSRNGKTSSGRTCPRNKFIAKELVSDTRLSTASAWVLILTLHCQYLQTNKLQRQTRMIRVISRPWWRIRNAIRCNCMSLRNTNPNHDPEPNQPYLTKLRWHYGQWRRV